MRCVVSYRGGALAALIGLMLPCTAPAAPQGDACPEAASSTTQPAASQPAASQPAEWQDWPHVTGNWGGVRDELENRGITLGFEHDSTFFVNTHGGKNTSHASTYTTDSQVTLNLDTTKLGLWQGGEFFIDGEERHGHGITERHVGDLMFVNNEEARDFVQVSQYWFRQNVWDGKLWLKLGKMDAADDFQNVDNGANFLNSSFGVIPTIPLPTYPNPALGVVLGVEPCEWLYVRGGVYDGESYGGSWGFDTAFHGRDDSKTLAEIGLKPSFVLAGRTLPGTYRIGGWYDSSVREEIPSRRRQRRLATYEGCSGVYLAFDQLIFKENLDPQDGQGLGAFFQFGWAPPRCTEITQYYGFGFQYTGLIPERDEDVVGLGVAHASLSERIQTCEGRYSETAIEWFYKIRITGAISLSPDLQYVVNPGGNGRDALVFGLRMSVSF